MGRGILEHIVTPGPVCKVPSVEVGVVILHPRDCDKSTEAPQVHNINNYSLVSPVGVHSGCKGYWGP